MTIQMRFSCTGGGPLGDVLQEANIPVISNSECAARTNPNFINDGHVCVYDPAQRMGGCNVSSIWHFAM